jgi:hypothetical protein
MGILPGRSPVQPGGRRELIGELIGELIASAGDRRRQPVRPEIGDQERGDRHDPARAQGEDVQASPTNTRRSSCQR